MNFTNRKKSGMVVHTRDTVDMTSRIWTEDEIRTAQLRVAQEALLQPKQQREEWLTEMLDILGLLPTDKNRIARFRTNMTSVALRGKPMIEETDVVTTDMERTTSRVVDTQGHGSVAGYRMHIKRYERPCEECMVIHEFVQAQDLADRGITVHDNHTVGYQ